MARSGPRSDVLFNNLSFYLGLMGLLLMIGFMSFTATVSGVAGTVPRMVFVAFAVMFWVEVAVIGTGIYFTFIQMVRNSFPKVIAGLVLNASALSMLVTFITVMSITGFSANLLLLV